ncbi:hypothetical protein LCGC14_1880510, partial [marine sediment metagenome]
MPRFTRIVFFLLLSSITLASCGWRTTGLENGFSDEPSTSPPRFEFSPEIRVTITDSFSDVTGGADHLSVGGSLIRLVLWLHNLMAEFAAECGGVRELHAPIRRSTQRPHNDGRADAEEEDAPDVAG